MTRSEAAMLRATVSLTVCLNALLRLIGLHLVMTKQTIEGGDGQIIEVPHSRRWRIALCGQRHGDQPPS